MSMSFACPTCGRSYTVADALAGKRARCKQCGTEMRIPTGSSRPERPEPADRFGLDEAESGPPARVAEPDAMPHALVPPRRTGARTARPRRRGEPWGLPIRNASIVFAALCLPLIALKANLPALRDAGGVALQYVITGTYALASIAGIGSVLGAAVSYLRGNERAFSGSGVLGSLTWGLAVVMGLFLGSTTAWLLLRPAENPRFALPKTPEAELASFEMLLQDLIDVTNEFSAAIEAADPEGAPSQWLRLKAAQARIDRYKDRAEEFPLPTLDQVRQLKVRYHAPFRAAVHRIRDAVRNAMERLPDGSKGAEALSPSVGRLSTYAAKYDFLYATGDDVTGWYHVIFSNRAGTRHRGPSGTVATGPRPGVVPEIKAPSWGPHVGRVELGSEAGEPAPGLAPGGSSVPPRFDPPPDRRIPNGPDLATRPGGLPGLVPPQPFGPPARPPGSPESRPPSSPLKLPPGRSTASRAPHTIPNRDSNIGQDTEFAGGTRAGSFRYVDPDGMLLGIDFATGRWDGDECLGRLTPVFARDQPPAPGTTRAIAPEGYAVGALEARTKRFVDAIRPVFLRITPDGRLDPDDRRAGDWLGYPHDAGTTTLLGGDGRRVMGIHCRQGAVLDGLALVMERPKP